MAQQNLVSGSLDDQTVRSMLETIQTLESNMEFLTSLSPDDRRRIVKLSDSHLNFVYDMRDVSQQKPDFLPRSFDLVELESDIKLSEQLDALGTALTHLAQRVDDTLLAVKSDMYSNSLEAYGYLQAARDGDGLDVYRSELRKYFVRRRRNNGTEEPQTKPSLA